MFSGVYDHRPRLQSISGAPLSFTRHPASWSAPNRPIPVHNTRAMTAPLYDLLPTGEPDADELLGRFLDFVDFRGLTLYPAQEEAVLALFEGRNVILNTPTGSGKSLVASALHFASLAHHRRSVYTCPI